MMSLIRVWLERIPRIELAITSILVATACALLCLSVLPGDGAGAHTAGALSRPTLTPTLTATPMIKCTPPACEPDEVYYCPDACPGGCGTVCATVTPTGVSVGFDRPAYTVGEGEGGAAITVALSVVSTRTITVQYADVENEALVGSDYVSTSGTLFFTPGITLLHFILTVLDDSIVEASETLSLTLSQPREGTLGLFRTAILTILDDDAKLYLPLMLRKIER